MTGHILSHYSLYHRRNSTVVTLINHFILTQKPLATPVKKENAAKKYLLFDSLAILSFTILCALLGEDKIKLLLVMLEQSSSGDRISLAVGYGRGQWNKYNSSHPKQASAAGEVQNTVLPAG